MSIQGHMSSSNADEDHDPRGTRGIIGYWKAEAHGVSKDILYVHCFVYLRLSSSKHG